MERIIRFDGLVGQRVGTGYPRFSRWAFDERIQDIESTFNSQVCTQ
jgi:hypothetical protein